MDMAVKTPNEKAIAGAGGVESFVRECHTWMDLGLHENIVTCHFVRVLGKVPRVFAEYVEGGTVSDWIKTGKIYEGSPEDVIEHILDIAIQFARGLEYAHSRGMVHQDVKPANVLITSDGIAKMSDFGLAGAALELPKGVQPEQTASVDRTFAGMTPLYASPEQAQAHAQRAAGVPKKDVVRITPQSDLYSWAVSIFEIFNGGVTWPSGTVVGEVFSEYLRTGPAEGHLPPMPESLAALIAKCLQENPDERPKSMSDVIESLKAIYGKETRHDYAREEPKQLAEMADVLNNKATSLLELGKADEAEKLWEEALKIDPHHAESTYGFSLRQWHKAEITDQEVVERMEELRFSHESDWMDEYCLGLVHMERGDGGSAVKVLEEIAEISSQNRKVLAALEQARMMDSSRQRTFDGCSCSSSVAISADGRFAITGSSDKTLQLWDINSGKCLRTFEGHTGEVESVAISPDGRFALSGSSASAVPLQLWDIDRGDGRLRSSGSTNRSLLLQLWDINSGKCLRTFKGQIRNVNSVAFSPDGRFALSGSDDNTARLWKINRRKCLRTFEGHTSSVFSVACSPDGRFALSGSKDKTLRLWEISTGRCLRTLEGHTRSVTSVAYSPDGRFALSGSDDCGLRLWEISTGRCLRTLEGHTSSVSSVAISPDGRFALSGSYDSSLRLWEISTGRCLRTFEGHIRSVTSVAYSPDGRFAISGSGDNNLRLWNIFAGVSQGRSILCKAVSISALIEYKSKVHDLFSTAKAELKAGNPAGASDAISKAASVPGYLRSRELLDLRAKAGLRGRIRRYAQGWHLRTFEGHTASVSSVAISPDGRFALSGSDDCDLRLWEMNTGKCLRTIEHRREVRSVAFSPDDRFALSGSDDYVLRLWEIRSGECLRLFQGHTDNLTSVAFSPDGRFALSGSQDGSIRVLDVNSGQKLVNNSLRYLNRFTEPVKFVAFSPDGRFVLSAGDKTLQVWNMDTWQCLRMLEVVSPVAISPDGRFALSGSKDRTLRLWDIIGGECLRTFKGEICNVNSLAYSSDGRFVLSGSEDKSVRLWDINSGQCLRTFKSHKGRVTSVACSLDGRFALSGSKDKTLRLWELVWNYEFPNPADWYDDAKPYLEKFLTLHTPYAAELPGEREPTHDQITRALTRRGKPSWNEEDFQKLLTRLSYCGYGWLRPDGVRRKLEEMAADWDGPPPLPEGK
ncbi:MAG: tetratricopeptide repeat protein [Candidatus Abyssobacteria bacterium SURF_5]|uniref:Tetratricopeptide repeat protein n=1 Tax=Abyssobacteria bacterium (strain SURF_5) TaxID=2093360 RepID=A0A3A4PDD3_ABYX5|nr:MAG: tetratricopeptide repeat protein [Candidatus Abyssubacteria bacterium SURF_5]